MKPDLAIAQCLVLADAAGPRVVSRSDDFLAAWEDAAQTTAVRFGRRPDGIRCPDALFALPVGTSHVAVVQVADHPLPYGTDLAFRFLVLGKPLYQALGDPFAIAERFPPNWSVRDSLPTLEWPPEPLPPRTVEHIQGVLKSNGEDMALLLGATQALIDGSRVLIVTPAPDTKLLRGLWQLLPTKTRYDLWPATFAFSTELGFHAAVVPEIPTPWPAGYLTAEQCRDYPEGRYELALQIAAEAGDQADLDRLFARRTSHETLRLAMLMIAAALVVALVSKFLL